MVCTQTREAHIRLYFVMWHAQEAGDALVFRATQQVCLQRILDLGLAQKVVNYRECNSTTQ
jgi:hypothetical protein